MKTTATIHSGSDIAAPDNTPVYATIDGIAAIRPGQRVTAFRKVVGRVEAPWAHVHFGERIGTTYVNPLRPGALSPYRDTTRVGRYRFLLAQDWDSSPS